MKNKNKEKDNHYPKSKFTFTCILRASVDDIERVNDFLNDFEDPQIVYQKCSPGKLYVRKEVGE